jgi:hypothetical protein
MDQHSGNIMNEESHSQCNLVCSVAEASITVTTEEVTNFKPEVNKQSVLQMKMSFGRLGDIKNLIVVQKLKDILVSESQWDIVF